MPVSTFRAWVLGLFLAIVVPGANQFFFFRYPAVNISQVRLRLFYPFIFVLSVAESSPPRVKHQVRPSPFVFPHGQAVGSLRAEGFPLWYLA